MEWLARTELLIGSDNISRINKLRVAVLGLGGVGSAAAEAIARAGVSHMLVIDSDKIDITNINRQLIATHDNIGLYKAEEIKKRLLSINPMLDITAENRFYLPEECEFLYDWQPDYVIDAIDTVTAKLHLAQRCYQDNIKLISCLGTGNRLDPLKLRIGDISDTQGQGCPLARIIRRELRKRDVPNLTVLYSEEAPHKSIVAQNSPQGRHSPASSAFVPPVAGYMIASYVVRDVIDI